MKKLINSIKSALDSLSLERIPLKQISISAFFVALLALIIAYNPAAYLIIFLASYLLLTENRLFDSVVSAVIGAAGTLVALILSIAIKPWFIALILLGGVMYFTTPGRAITLTLLKGVMGMKK